MTRANLEMQRFHRTVEFTDYDVVSRENCGDTFWLARGSNLFFIACKASGWLTVLKPDGGNSFKALFDQRVDLNGFDSVSFAQHDMSLFRVVRFYFTYRENTLPKLSYLELFYDKREKMDLMVIRYDSLVYSLDFGAGVHHLEVASEADYLLVNPVYKDGRAFDHFQVYLFCAPSHYESHFKKRVCSKLPLDRDTRTQLY